MIPRVLVWQGKERSDIHNYLDTREEQMIVCEGSGANVVDFRRWVNSAMETLAANPKYIGVIWDAHKLSWECQAVLLKPLEETGEAKIVLVTEAENLLAETVLSRCTVERLEANNGRSSGYWPRVMQAWKQGPAECMRLSDELSQEEALALSEEAVEKLRGLVRSEVNSKRVDMLQSALTLMEEMRARNLNVKLCLGEFLLSGWRMSTYYRKNQ